MRRASSERMKLAHEAKRQREETAKREETLLAREAKLKEWESEYADRRRNPAKYLTADYGPDWYDKLSSVKLSGSPTPDLIASEVDGQVGLLKKELADVRAEFKKTLADRDAADAQRSREADAREAISYVKGNAEKYPLIHDFDVAENINAVIEAHFNSTCSRDDVTGETVPGEMWTAEQAATAMEKHLAEKYDRATLRKKPPPPTVVVASPLRVSTPQRRTLSTDMSAASPSWTPPKDDRERQARAEAAWNAARAARN